VGDGVVGNSAADRFRLATSRVTLILIILVLAVRLLRPALFST